MATERRYGLDWIRADAAIFTQLFLPWGMPLFFVISGLSARLATADRSTDGFAGERLTRMGMRTSIRSAPSRAA